MRRTVTLEVDEGGGLAWKHGELEISEGVAGSFTSLLPLTLIEVEGDFQLRGPSDGVLRVRKPPVVISTPLARALRGWSEAELLDRFLRVLETDRSGDACALRAASAAREGRRDDALRHFTEALLSGATSEAADPLELAWTAIGGEGRAAALDRPVKEALVRHVWRSEGTWQRPWQSWICPLVSRAYAQLEPGNTVNYPWHFGGPRVEPDFRVLAPWLVARFDALVTEEDRPLYERLRSMSPPERRRWLAASEARDTRRCDDANAAAIARHPPDSEGSPPDGGDPGPLERDEVPATWARFSSALEEDATSPWSPVWNVGYELSKLHSRSSPVAARAFVLALDAATIASRVSPELAPRVHEVVFVSARHDEGLAVVRLAGDGLCCLLHGASGPFGGWEARQGDGETIVAALPSRLRSAGAAALRGDRRGEVIAEGTMARFGDDPRLRRRPFALSHSSSKRGPQEQEEPASRPPGPRIVSHPKLGKGRVVGERVDGGQVKLEVDFDGLGRKVVLQRFVEDVPLDE